MNDYGFKPHSLLFIVMEPGYYPEATDVYSPSEPNYGNSNYGKSEFREKSLYWDSPLAGEMDTRLFYVYRNRMSWSLCRWDPTDESIPKWWRISRITEKQICYTPEALKYA